MQMDSRLILAGRQPDVLGSYATGTEVGRRDALYDLYRDQGSGIAAGEQGALNALAQFDPQAALGVQRSRQVMNHADQANSRANQAQKWDAEKMDMLRQQARLSAADRVAGMKAEDRAVAMQELQGVLKGAATFYKQGDEAGYNQWLEKNGQDPAAYPFGAFPAHAAQLLGIMDVLAGPEPADEYQRYVQEEQAAGREPLSRIDYAQAKKGQGTTVYDPETGRPLVTMGGGQAQPPKMTVDAAKNTGFLIRMNDANSVLNDLEGQGTEFVQQNLEKVPLGLGNYGRSPDFQKYDQARRDFVNAVLRRESGAVIADSEFENANKQYFPVPGDSPEVIEQKRRNRINAIEGVRAGSGEGAAYADGMQPAKPAADVNGDAPQFLNEQDAGLWDYMTPEERAAILKTYEGQQ